ncbi:hypothetical protein ACOSQ3_018911 [Xanthoceras sorbifolium]
MWLFNITTLKTVLLGDCELSGSIPSTVLGGNLCNLQALSGCNNSTLETLDLSSNRVSGGLPSSLVYFKYLKYLRLSQNSFSGSLPTSIGNLSLLGSLDLSFNKMNGMISENIGQLTKFVITKSHLQNLTRLSFLFLSSINNSLVFNVSHIWIAPFNLYNIAINDCKLGPVFPYWLRTQVSFSQFILSSVAISDIIPDWFWRSLSPKVWRASQVNNVCPNAWIDLGFHYLEGSLPLWSNVTHLSLRNNLLAGPIPLYVGYEMAILQNLDLSGNLLNGSIPLSMSKMLTLSFLDLSNNYLSEEIPSNLQGLKRLLVLDLSNNKLFRGIQSVCSLPSLLWLNLRSNNLFGELFKSLKSCTSLFALDLGENRFFGTISVTKNLFFLIYLGLRANIYLNLSYNNLSVRIPTSNQFNTWTDPSIYESNPYLCGPPLTTNCSLGHGDSKDKNEEVEDDHEDGSEKFWFYINRALGFIVGFWDVCGTLMIKKSWRPTYFRFVEEIKDKLYVTVAVSAARLYTN